MVARGESPCAYDINFHQENHRVIERVHETVLSLEHLPGNAQEEAMIFIEEYLKAYTKTLIELSQRAIEDAARKIEESGEAPPQERASDSASSSETACRKQEQGHAMLQDMFIEMLQRASNKALHRAEQSAGEAVSQE